MGMGGEERGDGAEVIVDVSELVEAVEAIAEGAPRIEAYAGDRLRQTARMPPALVAHLNEKVRGAIARESAPSRPTQRPPRPEPNKR